MLELSSLMGKPVLCRSGCNIVGAVADAALDAEGKNVLYLCVQSPDCPLQAVPLSCVVAIRDAVMLEGNEDIAFVSDLDVTSVNFGMLGKAAYTPFGGLKGCVTDILFAQSGKIYKYVLGDDELSPSLVAAIGDVIMLKGTAQSKRKPARIPRPKQEAPVYLLGEAAGTAVALSSDGREPVFSKGAFELVSGAPLPDDEEDGHTPTRIICEYDFLLGRRLGCDLKTYAGELIAPKGSEVSSVTVESARRAGKLVELALNSVMV